LSSAAVGRESIGGAVARIIMNELKSILTDNVKELLGKGVVIPEPLSVEIGREVDPGRISGHGVVLSGGTRIHGARTLISAGVRLGGESPATLDDCLLGPDVELKGGYFKSSVFLGKASMASGAHVREGCLLEEEAGAGHTVGLKQTILFPFVTLGSLINFCDCFMAGGTSRKNHSEVGSSYIHFNYTPHQDKATPSLLGDVPRGVMLNQPPIFLGGQGGLVGPVRIGYGCAIAAGTIYRKDCPDGGKWLVNGGEMAGEKDFHPGHYGDIRRKVLNNIIYIANLAALRQWYLQIRRPLLQKQELGEALCQGALETLQRAIAERICRLRALSEKMNDAIALSQTVVRGEQTDALILQKREFRDRWPDVEAVFTGGDEDTVARDRRDPFMEIFFRQVEERSTDYIRAIQGLPPLVAQEGTLWLQTLVESIVGKALRCLPSFSR
jgi:bifunctional UDP-N-acetylglucosamine pyrophosphorylase / glucosamine-1-phosphate N-acetyltransferase